MTIYPKWLHLNLIMGSIIISRNDYVYGGFFSKHNSYQTSRTRITESISGTMQFFS